MMSRFSASTYQLHPLAPFPFEASRPVLAVGIPFGTSVYFRYLRSSTPTDEEA